MDPFEICFDTIDATAMEIFRYEQGYSLPEVVKVSALAQNSQLVVRVISKPMPFKLPHYCTATILPETNLFQSLLPAYPSSTSQSRLS